jgi:hypothetical protein
VEEIKRMEGEEFGSNYMIKINEPSGQLSKPRMDLKTRLFNASKFTPDKKFNLQPDSIINRNLTTAKVSAPGLSAKFNNGLHYKLQFPSGTSSYHAKVMDPSFPRSKVNMSLLSPSLRLDGIDEKEEDARPGRDLYPYKIRANPTYWVRLVKQIEVR